MRLVPVIALVTESTWDEISRRADSIPADVRDRTSALCVSNGWTIEAVCAGIILMDAVKS